MDEKLVIYTPNEIEDTPISPVLEETGDTDSTKDSKGVDTPASIPSASMPNYVMASDLINASLDTQKRKILSSYGFTETGAIQIGKYVATVSGEIKISPDGIVAINKSNVTTFAIDGETGDATFLGTVAAGSIIAASITVDGSSTFGAGYNPTDKVDEIGGNYTTTSTAAAAKVKIFPDANTGIIAYASDGSTVVLKVEVGGTNVGDVTIGNYAGGYGMLWDQSAGTLKIKGNIEAGSMDADRITTGTLGTSRIPNLSADKITSGTINASIVTVTNLNASNITTGTLNASSISVTNLNATNIVSGNYYAGGTGHPTSIIIHRNGSDGFLTWEGGNKIWTDGSEYMGFSADGERFYFYTGATLYALFQRGSQAGFFAGISCEGAFNVVGANARFGGKIYTYESGTSQYIDSDSDDQRYYSTDNHEFYQGTTIKAIIDGNIWTAGDLAADGSKPFIIPHPDGSNRLLRYTAQESPDVSLRFRGIGEIVDGVCEIDLPNHFILVTEPTGLVTVNLTQMQDKQGLYVLTIHDNDHIVIAGKDGKFMFEVVAIRKGYLNQAVEIGEDSKDVRDKDFFDKRKEIESKNVAAKADRSLSDTANTEAMDKLRQVGSNKGRTEKDHK